MLAIACCCHDSSDSTTVVVKVYGTVDLTLKLFSLWSATDTQGEFYQLREVSVIAMTKVLTPFSRSHDCRDINRAQVARKKEAIAYFSIESALALLISLFINLCVVSVFAKGFYGKEAGDIGLKNAGDYLGERFGSHMVAHLGCTLLA